MSRLFMHNSYRLRNGSRVIMLSDYVLPRLLIPLKGKVRIHCTINQRNDCGVIEQRRAV